jgi:hypothetical protein
VSTIVDREMTARGPTARTEDDGYAHVLLDEAQDLSPMQWRMVARRGRYASWTIVGDATQSSWPDSEQAALARAAALRDKPVHNFHLSTNDRNSKEIFDFAATIVRKAVADPDLPQAVRQTGEQPVHVAAAPGGDALRHSVAESVAELLASVEGTVGVVTPHARRGEVSSWLADSEPSRLSIFDGVGSRAHRARRTHPAARVGAVRRLPTLVAPRPPVHSIGSASATFGRTRMAGSPR